MSEKEKDTLPQLDDNQAGPGEATASDENAAMEQTTGESGLPGDQDQLLAQIEADLAAANDRALRAQAELENFRKRAFRQMEDERKYASLPVLRDLLPVLDNLQRAIGSAEQSSNGQALLEGVKLVSHQLTNVLQQHHCTEMDAKGKLFDPHQHEAIAQLPSNEHPPGTVIDVTQTGYMLHDRVVRAAQVLVSAGPAKGSGAGDEETSSSGEDSTDK